MLIIGRSPGQTCTHKHLHPKTRLPCVTGSGPLKEKYCPPPPTDIDPWNSHIQTNTTLKHKNTGINRQTGQRVTSVAQEISSLIWGSAKRLHRSVGEQPVSTRTDALHFPNKATNPRWGQLMRNWGYPYCRMISKTMGETNASRHRMISHPHLSIVQGPTGRTNPAGSFI